MIWLRLCAEVGVEEWSDGEPEGEGKGMIVSKALGWLCTLLGFMVVGSALACSSSSHSSRSFLVEGQKVRPSERTAVSKALNQSGAGTKIQGPAGFCLDTLQDARQYASLDGKPDAAKIEFVGRGKWHILGDVPMTVEDAKSDPAIVKIRADIAPGTRQDCWMKAADLEPVNAK